MSSRPQSHRPVRGIEEFWLPAEPRFGASAGEELRRDVLGLSHTAQTIIVVRGEVSSASHPMDVGEMRARVRESDLAARRDLARKFADRIRGMAGVEGVYLSTLEPDLRITVVIGELSIERELQLRAIFIELTRELPDSSIGDLSVITDEADADDLGESLT